MSAATCPTCGRPLDEHDRHVRLLLPDPVLDVPEAERAARTWGGDPLLQVQGIGAFVRVLLPIRLTGGFSLTIGTWLGIHPDRLHEVWAQWETDAYATLVLDGHLANAIPPWGDTLLAAPAVARVRSPSEVPYIESSEHAMLAQVVEAEWPHRMILDAYASVV